MKWAAAVMSSVRGRSRRSKRIVNHAGSARLRKETVYPSFVFATRCTFEARRGQIGVGDGIGWKVDSTQRAVGVVRSQRFPPIRIPAAPPGIVYESRSGATSFQVAVTLLRGDEARCSR